MDKELYQLNAKLQQKKNLLRKSLAKKGVLKREGNNAFDKYKYFSEAQYKLLFTELFSENNLELRFSEVGYETFDGTDKQANGRMPRLRFELIDCETGYWEESIITGEGIDKGDKAGYKAYTGALKYYLATTFLVATGDDPETESPEAKVEKKPARSTPEATPKASPEQIALIRKAYGEEQCAKMCEAYKLERLEEMNVKIASNLVAKIKEKERTQK